MAAASAALPWFALGAFGQSLVIFLMYISVRHHPAAPVSLFGLVSLPSLYLPWAFLALAAAGLGGDPRGVGLGIVAGHVVWFLTAVHPRVPGARAVLAPPRWLVRACMARGVGAVPAPAAAAAAVNPSDPGFRPFAGRGQRLGQARREEGEGPEGLPADGCVLMKEENKTKNKKGSDHLGFDREGWCPPSTPPHPTPTPRALARGHTKKGSRKR
jgi:hypothetical protein